MNLRCYQEAYDKLPRALKEALPYLHQQAGSNAAAALSAAPVTFHRSLTELPWFQALVQQQQNKAQRSFVDYQLAYDAHQEAKAAVAALEAQLMSTAGVHQRWSAPNEL